jgi:Tfp pilus assembly protein PilF
MRLVALALPLCALGCVAVAACQTTPQPQPVTDDVTTNADASADGTAGTDVKAANPPVAPAEPVAAPSSNGAANAGIDDENWLPAQGSARDTFLSAVEVARHDPAAAVPRFVEAAGKAQYFYAAWYNAGAAAEASSDLQIAEKYYRQALAVRPDYGPALTNLAGVLEKTGRAAEAQRVIDDALRKNPEKAGPHLAAATLAWSRKDLTQVEREALLTIKYDERNVPAMRLMAMLFRQQGRLDTARFALDNALEVEPGNALLHLELGHVQKELGDDKAALVSFEKAARLRPTLLEALDNYGVLLLKQGMANEAANVLSQSAKLDPRSPRAMLHLGNALRASKQYAAAEASYKKALELDPTLAEARFNIGVLYIDNPLPGIEELPRLQKGLAELREFKKNARVDAATTQRLDEYIDATDKRIQKEIKRREREERRKREEDAAKAAPAPAAAGSGNPPATGAVPPAPGK